MVGSGVGIMMCGSGILAANSFGVPSSLLIILGASGLGLATFGTTFTILQFYRYLNRVPHNHNDW